MEPITNQTPQPQNLSGKNELGSAQLPNDASAKAPETRYRTGNMATRSGSIKRSISLPKFELSRILGYMVIIISLFITVVLVFVVLIPQSEKYNQNQDELSMASIELQKVSARYEYLKSLKDLGASFDENVTLAKQSITEIEEVPQLLNQIAVLSDLSLTTLETNSFSGVSANQPQAQNNKGLINPNLGMQNQESATLQPLPAVPNILSVSSTITGTYDQIIELMKKVEAARRLTTVVSFDLSINTGDTDDQKLELKEENFIIANLNAIESDAIVDVIYDLEVNFNAFYMKDPDITAVPVDFLLSKPAGIDLTLNKIKEYTYYKLEELAPFYDDGTNNPFDSTGSSGGIQLEDETN